ncbi:MAG: RluA family pseudouridine synthase [Planctomycetes bacterium]|nr:RluA family pseudouridine synthase [Planctomycetota bacterium]
MIEWTIDRGDAGTRLDAWLARRPETGSRGRARVWLERGKVFLNGAAVAFPQAGRKLRAGDVVGLWIDRPGTSHPRRREITAARLSLRVVLEDTDLLVADKPPGLLVEPLPGQASGEVTLVDLVADHLRSRIRARPLVVHRIDRDTSGLVLFALNREAQQALKAQFEQHTPERTYLALVRGTVAPATGTWQDRLAWDKERLVQKRAHRTEAAGKDAIARYRVVEQLSGAALLDVSLVTGKRNKIRVQAGSRGHALVGERLYTFGAPPPGRGEPTLARQALHASRLSFIHPATGKRVNVTAPLPDDMRRLIDALRVQPR